MLIDSFNTVERGRSQLYPYLVLWKRLVFLSGVDFLIPVIKQDVTLQSLSPPGDGVSGPPAIMAWAEKTKAEDIREDA